LAVSKISAGDVVAICCSTQGEGTIAVGRDGRPLMNAITWMDMRGAEDLRRHIGGPLSLFGYDPVRLLRWLRLTGGAPALSGKDPAAHMLLIRNRFPEIYERTYKFLNVLDYFNLRLTGRFVATHDSILTSWVTDNRDVDRIRYDQRLVTQSGIERDKFPEIVPCSTVLGPLLPEIAADLGLPAGVQVVAGAIDNSAAAIGAGTLDDFDPHLYIGTSSWFGAHMPKKKTDLATQIAAVPCALPGKYLMVAMQTSAGNNLSFLKERVLYHRDELLSEAQVPDIYKVLDRIAGGVPPGADGLIYTPWLFGERCPVEDRSLRAGLFNLSIDHSRETIIRAFFEGVALNTRWMVKPVEKFTGRPLRRLTMLGGGAASDVWCQIFADALGVPIRQLAEPMQGNALGAATIARVGLGLTDFATAAERTQIRAEYAPNPAHRAVYDQRFETFTELYRRLGPLYRRLQPGGALG
jgi:xylulokinase